MKLGNSVMEFSRLLQQPSVKFKYSKTVNLEKLTAGA